MAVGDARETSVLRLGDGAQAMEIGEDGKTRWLRYVGGAVQSRMDLAAPQRLVLPYTRAMMTALLFVEAPGHAALLGLGGGSLARFLRHAFPAVRITAVERHRAVIDAARERFLLPGESEGCAVLEGDARERVDELEVVDLLAVDLFEENGLPAWVGGAEFCTRCHDRLRPGGALAANLWLTSDDEFLAVVGGLNEAFDRRVLLVPVAGYRNIIALAFPRRPAAGDFATLYRRAAALEARTGLALARFVAGMRGANLHDERSLIL